MSQTEACEVVLKIRDLQVRFAGHDRVVHALRGVDLDLRRGEIHALVGESGSGKSTLALTVTRLNDHVPGVEYRGEVLLRGEDLLRCDQRRLREVRGGRVAMIFQDPGAALDPMQRSGDHVMEALRAHRSIRRAQARREALAALKTAGIADAENRFGRYPHELSGGLRQRVMIAGGIVAGSEVLIADEPTTALDTTVQAQVLVGLRRLALEMGLAILLITHDLAIVSEVADRVTVMYAGRVVEAADVVGVVESPRHPYTRGLLASVPRLSGSRGREFSGIPGQPHNGQTVVGCAFAPRCGLVDDRCRREAPPRRRDDDGRVFECWNIAASSTDLVPAAEW